MAGAMMSINQPICAGLAWALALLLAWTGPVAGAEISIAHVAGFTGAAAAGVIENGHGADIYFNYVNRHGGIEGATIKRVAADDQFNAQLTLKIASDLLDRHPFVALMLSRGTPQSEALMPWALKHRIPMVAPSTGAMSLRTAKSPFVFNLRSPYRSEASAAIAQLTALGFNRLAVIAPDDSFGDDATFGLDEQLAKVNAKKVYSARFKKTDPQFESIYPALSSAQPNAVILLGPAEAVSTGLKVFQSHGLRVQYLTLSNNASDGFIKLAGKAGHGVLVMQSFPNERSDQIPVCKEFKNMAKSQGITAITPAMLEGYLAAKIVVAGLQRAGKHANGVKLARALANLAQFDLGGISVNYGSDEHHGTDSPNASIISEGGRFLR